MRFWRERLPWLFFLLLSSQVVSAAERTVVVLGVDGFASRYAMEPNLPTFKALHENGAFASLVSAFPSITFPNFVTLATGCSPNRHGIIGNVFYEFPGGEKFNYSSDPKWLECEPIWNSAERQGIKTAVLDWPMSYGAWKGIEATYHRERYAGANTAHDVLVEVSTLLGLAKNGRPSLILAYAGQVDKAGHTYGPNSEERKKALEDVDREVGLFLSRWKPLLDSDQLTFVVVSDHGMSSSPQVIFLDEIVAKKNLDVSYVADGAIAHLYSKSRSDIPKLLEEMNTVPNTQWYTRDTLPKKWGKAHRNMGDVIGVVNPPFALIVKDPKRTPPLGMHGYDPADPEMLGVLFVTGRGAANVSLETPVENIHFSATISKLVGMAPPANNTGRALLELLE